MARWTAYVIAHRKRVVVVWLLLLVLGGFAFSDVGHLLTNRFSVPGSDAERGLSVLKQRFAERGDGAFTLVVQGTGGRVDPRVAREAAARGAAVIDQGKAGVARPAAPNVTYVQITTPLQGADAANETDRMRRAIGTVPGARTYLTGFPAIQHDIQPIYDRDTGRGESVAVLVALVVMAFMFGTLGGIVVPLIFALTTIPVTIGFVWIVAHYMQMAQYVTQIVALIGIAIAIDYSMLVVFRYREELDAGRDPREALLRTMATAGRATLFSGLTVAVGLALLLLMPLPFMRSMGVGGVLIPLVSIAAAATFLPALLAMFGPRINRLRIVPRRVLARRAAGTGGFWGRLARSIMRRPIPYLATAALVMLALATPAVGIQLTGGDNRGLPGGTDASSGLKILEATLGPGALSPHQIVVDTGQDGGAAAPGVLAAERRLVAGLRRDPAIEPSTVQAPVLASPAFARAANLVDPAGRAIQIRASGRTDAGTKTAVALVHRIRDSLLPAAGFPGTSEILVTGAPAFGVDFVGKAYGAFPWLVLAVLVVSYFLLLRAFRSVVLPIKAVLMNLLSVSATYGVLVLAFQHGVGKVVGLQETPQIEGWIPIFLFAMLFGLSMDYEVFLLSRMREEWDARHDNEHAVAYGLEHTGRIITAAAVIMIAAFAGFTTGSFVGLQEFGVGLSAAILLDATVVRMVLVPATMKLLGNWNWYLPDSVRRALRLAPGGPEPAPMRGGAE